MLARKGIRRNVDWEKIGKPEVSPNRSKPNSKVSARREEMKDKTNVTLLGDSMLKGVKSNQLRDNNVRALFIKTLIRFPSDIVDLAKSMKTGGNDIVISTIATRADKHKHKQKASAIDKMLELSKKAAIGIIDNSNINECLSRDGLHLNFQGSQILTNNLRSEIIM